MLLRQQIVDAVAGDPTVPATMRDAVHRYLAETRAIGYVVIGPDKAGDVSPPDEAALARYFEEHKAEFAAPQYRKLNLVLASPDKLARPEEVPEEDIRAAYERLKPGRFERPERRVIERLGFPTIEDARAAAARIRSGTTFDEIARERGIQPAALAYGTYTRDAAPDKAAAEAVFALDRGRRERPGRDGALGPALLRVTEVEPALDIPFEAAQADLRRDLAASRSKGAMRAVADRVEDQRASARPLTEIAREMKLDLVSVDAVDQQGRDKTGRIVDLPDRDPVLRAAFASDIGVDNESISTPAGGTIWYEVVAIEPARERALDEVRPAVEAAWRAEEVVSRVAAKAASLVKRLDAGESLATVAAAEGVGGANGDWPQAQPPVGWAVERGHRAGVRHARRRCGGRARHRAAGADRPPGRVRRDAAPSPDDAGGGALGRAAAPRRHGRHPGGLPRRGAARGRRQDQRRGRPRRDRRRGWWGRGVTAHAPVADLFASVYESGRAQIVRATLVADLETPVSAFLKLTARGGPNAFLLESVEGGAVRGRYSMIGLDPDLVWRCRGDAAEVNRDPSRDPDAFVACEAPPLDALRELLRESAIDADPDLPPMAAGLFGYLGYDMVRHMERLGAPNPDPLGLPDAVLVRPTVMAVFDAVRDEIVVLAPVRPRPGIPARAAFKAAMERIERVLASLECPLDRHDAPPADARAGAAASNLAPEDYRAMVARAKDYIAAGDVFQVVLSQRFEAPFPLPAFSLYRSLRRVNPAPFLCYLDFGAFQVVCSSPEILVRVREGRVTIRPIAGTRPRGASPAEDRALGEELLADEKELAEHLMLLDLGRNDVGRVASVGSVSVTDSFFLERYSQVMHIVSNVEGSLDPAHDALDALAAGFPAGTVSGAPKVRAMEIIDELEPEGRGLYGGCIGYFGADGSMDTCIVLRTAIVKDGRMYVQAGAGIVHDSSPASEQAECMAKARALFRAAEEAVRFASTAGRGQ